MIGTSQSTMSRMELGRGTGVAVNVWTAAAAAVGMRLVLTPATTAGQEADSLARRCHRTIVDAARRGGWAAETVVEGDRRRPSIETVLTRCDELVVVRVWDLVTDIGAGIDDLLAGVERARCHSDGARVAGLVVVPSGQGNRRRMTEGRTQLRVVFPTLAAHWFRAIRSERWRMPRDPGVLWADPQGGRLLLAPLVPGWAWVTPDHGSAALRWRSGE
jgi:hypothetical protein